MKIASNIMSFVTKIAATEPWGSTVEQYAVRLGHMAPGSKIVRSFCLHLGFHLLHRNEVVERVAVLSSGGKMLLHLIPNTVQYYFLGTMDSCPIEVPVERLLKRALREGDIFFDIGANVGFYTFLAAPLCGENGWVHAFEANPKLSTNLIRSAGLNRFPKHIVINSKAVGETHGGEIALYLPSNNCSTGIPSTIQHEWLNSGSKISVPLISIDGYVLENKIVRLDVVKIDIEGGELNAFKGMVETFKNTPPALVICELMAETLSFVKDEGNYRRSASAPGSIEIIKFMGSQGYQPWHIRTRDGKLDHVSSGDEVVRIASSFNVCFARPGLQQARPELFAND